MDTTSANKREKKKKKTHNIILVVTFRMVYDKYEGRWTYKVVLCVIFSAILSDRVDRGPA